METRPSWWTRRCATGSLQSQGQAGPTISAGRRPDAIGPSGRQHARAHQVLVDGARRLPTLADRPDDQRLAAPHVARHEHLWRRGAIIAVVRGDVPAPVELDPGFLQQSRLDRSGEADGEEDEVGLEQELRPGDRLALLVDAGADHADGPALLALDPQGGGLELALRALGLRGGGPELGRPVGPHRQLVLPLRGLGPDVELRHRERALPKSRADAIG